MEGEREVPPAEGGGDGGGAVPIFMQLAQDPLAQEQRMPMGLGMPLGTIPKVEEEAGDAFTERSLVPSDFGLGFGYDQFGRTPAADVTTPSSEVPPLRETTIVDPPGVQTFATLTPMPSTVMRPRVPSPGLEIFSYCPPLVLTCEGGASFSVAAPVGPSGSSSITSFPAIP